MMKKSSVVLSWLWDTVKVFISLRSRYQVLNFFTDEALEVVISVC